jgi:hypothetical protein
VLVESPTLFARCGLAQISMPARMEARRGGRQRAQIGRPEHSAPAFSIAVCYGDQNS